MKIWVCILLLKFKHIQGAVDEEYVYNYESVEEAAHSGETGHRLVGADRADINAIPFLVGYAFQNPDEEMNYQTACTGSLIANQWVVSAAHCITGLVGTDDIPECVETTKAEGKYVFMVKNKVPKGMEARFPNGIPDTKHVVKCEYTKKGKSIKIFPIEPAGVAFLGASDNNDIEKIKEVKAVKIDYVIRHEKSYRGGGSYGTYGGYDITLLHLAKEAKAQCETCPKPKNACLPRKSFKDSGIGTVYNTGGATLAGYGKFMRRACQTDEYGESKYHYCSDPKCETESPPPVPKVCKNFFDNKKTPNSIPEDLTEIVVTDKTGHNYCTRLESPKSGSKGWCHVNVDATKMMGMTKMKKSWGFCSEDCYDHKKNESNFSVLRKLDDVDILNDVLCNMYLKNSMPQGKSTTVLPKVLCIGKLENLKFEHWLKKGNTYTKSNKKMKNHRMSIFPDIPNYVRSVGTCNGDSGGPVFVKRQGRHIVLGAVSGGRGGLRDCGGVNNPTHYARISAFGTWITNMLGPDASQLCWFDKNGNERNSLPNRNEKKEANWKGKEEANWNGKDQANWNGRKQAKMNGRRANLNKLRGNMRGRNAKSNVKNRRNLNRKKPRNMNGNNQGNWKGKNRPAWF